MRINDLEGTIMCKDTELCWFHIRDCMIDIRPIGVDENYTPFEFIEGYTKQSVYDFVNDRLPEDGRQDLHMMCKYYGIPVRADAILKFNNGRTLDDPCWIRYEEGPQTYEEVQSN